MSLKEMGVMLIVSVVLLALVNKVPPLVGQLAMGGGAGSLGSGFGAGAAIGTAAMGAAAVSSIASTAGAAVLGGATSIAGGAQALMAAYSKAAAAEGAESGSRDMLATGIDSGSPSPESGHNGAFASAMGDTPGGQTQPAKKSARQNENDTRAKPLDARNQKGQRTRAGTTSARNENASNQTSAMSTANEVERANSVSASADDDETMQNSAIGREAITSTDEQTAQSDGLIDENGSSPDDDATIESDLPEKSSRSGSSTGEGNIGSSSALRQGGDHGANTIRKVESGDGGKGLPTNASLVQDDGLDVVENATNNRKPESPHNIGMPGQDTSTSAISGTGATLAKAGRIAVGTAANLAQGSWDVTKNKANEIKKSAMLRIGDTTGGKIAAAIKVRESPSAHPDTSGSIIEDGNTLSAGTNEPADAAAEVAAFRDRDSKPS